MTMNDMHLVNSLLELHINNFLAFFTQRRVKKEFNKIDCHLTLFEPVDVLLNGFEDKLYHIHEIDLEDLSLYHTAKRDRTLHTLLPFTGTVEAKFFSKRVKNLLHRGCDNYRSDIFMHYKHIWEKFKSILSVLHNMKLEIDQGSLTAFDHRQISCN